MNILVTGPNGFLGSSVVHRLRRTEFQVRTISRRFNSGDYYFINDLGNSIELISILNSFKPDIIVNTAAVANFSNQTPTSDFYSINTLLPSILADWAKKNHSYLIQISGILIHGFNHSYFNCRTPEIPDTNYGMSKHLADKMIITSGCDFAILRMGGIFGKNGPEHLGINRAIKNAAMGIIPSYIATGATKRNYLFVEDAALIVETCVNKRLKGIFYCGGEILSIKDMLTMITDVFIPGAVPVSLGEGNDTHDQIIENSLEFSYRKFLDCLNDCK
ncbi:NAD-dependent epimerase/dehydratase family protein [Leptospira noguchii]|uniref:NAD-dependent epimerase/dehydratase family protein n=1 Tax=Leptospira noguchii TaxID=28182 RepID=UPI000772DBEF|nr:NAD(P)-dependent oxidoreductase [Leptospira noguchii]UOG59333.1 NAD(P)-dependent oxidoreductase [Leptospira noguchii]